MAEILSTVSTVSFVLAAVFFLFASFFWIKFEIISIIGDLSGRTAKKSIAKMREKNEKTGKKSFKPSFVNIERGKLTDTMKASQKLNDTVSKKSKELFETGLLEENKVDNSDTNVTELLEDNNATSLLIEKVIERPEDNSTILLNDYVANNQKKKEIDIDFTMLDEVVIIHTNEIIQ